MNKLDKDLIKLIQIGIIIIAIYFILKGLKVF